MKHWIYIFIVLTSCSSKSEKDIIYDKIWVNKNNLMTAYFDSSFFILDNLNYNYSLSKDTLSIWIINDINDSLGYIDDTFQFRLDYIDNDSLILFDLNSDSTISSDNYHRFYSKELLYDSLINLKSISFKNGSPLSNQVTDAIYLDNDSMYMRIDTGSHKHKLLDYDVNFTIDDFNRIQDLIRLIEIEAVDTIFPCYEYHTYWIIKIQYNNTKTVLKGCFLSEPFSTIWYEIKGMAYKSEYYSMKNNTNIKWLELIEPEGEIKYDYDK